MTDLSRILAEAERLVIPEPKEEEMMAELAKSLLAKTRRAAENHPQTRGVLLGGSFAKGTWLPGLVDLDIFVKFDPAISDEEFERVGLAIGSATTKGHPRGKKYAQHPYTEATVHGVKVNIVPCFDVKKGMWRSAADRSPFHVKLVRDLPTNLKIQVKLLKRFMKSVGVYGAEIKTRGFSGYVAEVLVLNSGGLGKVLRWLDNYPSGSGPYFSLPDPVDPTRDLGIAVSGESVGRLVLASREFLNRPHLAYFQRMRGKHRPLLEREVIGLRFSHRRLSEDTLWGELRRTCKHIVRHAEINGFIVARSMCASDDAFNSAFLLIPEFDELPPLGQRIGPTVDRKKDVKAFIQSNAKKSRLVWVDDDARVRLLIPRQHISFVEMLEQVAKGKAGAFGASAELETGMKKSGSVLYGNSLIRAASKAEWLRNGIREITTDAVGAS